MTMEITTRPPDKLIARARTAIMAVLPREEDPDRLIKIALLAHAQGSEPLRQCSFASVLSCAVQAAQLGLEVGGVSGESYLVPYGQTAQLIVGYRGFVQLVWRAAEVLVDSDAVREADHFSVTKGSVAKLEHVIRFAGDRGEVIGAWARAVFPDLRERFEVLTREQVDAIRARSKSANKGPWVTDYAEMARKTAVRRLAKYLPIRNPEKGHALSQAVELDERRERAEAPHAPEAFDALEAAEQEADLEAKVRKARDAMKDE